MSYVIGSLPAVRRDYTKVPNSVARDGSLSPNAKSVLLALLSHTEGFVLDIRDIVAALGRGLDSAYRALAELERRGILSRRQRNQNLSYGDVEIHLGNPPLPIDHSENPGNADDLRKLKKPQVAPTMKTGGTLPIPPEDHLQEDHLLAPPAPLTVVPAPEGEQQMKPKHPANQPALFTDEPVLTGDLVPASTPVQVEQQQTNAGQIVKAWLDYCTGQGKKLPRRIIGQYAKLIGEAVGEGFDRDLIVRALASMLADGVADRPSLLPNRLVRVQTGPEVRRTLHERDGMLVKSRTAQNLDLVARMAALDAVDEGRQVSA